MSAFLSLFFDLYSTVVVFHYEDNNRAFINFVFLTAIWITVTNQILYQELH